jgi:hypothetical protein
MTLVNYSKGTRAAVHTCVDTRCLRNEVTIDAKPASASLLAGILFEDVNRYPPSSEANCRGQSGE